MEVTAASQPHLPVAAFVFLHLRISLYFLARLPKVPLSRGMWTHLILGSWGPQVYPLKQHWLKAGGFCCERSFTAQTLLLSTSSTFVLWRLLLVMLTSTNSISAFSVFSCEQWILRESSDFTQHMRHLFSAICSYTVL